jgi:hypothetical protein
LECPATFVPSFTFIGLLTSDHPPDSFAIHEHRIAGSPLQRVELLDHIRHNKWKVKWIDPNRGFVDYIEPAQIIVLWRTAL